MMTTPECKYSLVFSKVDQSASLTFDISVLPDRAPEAKGQLVALDELKWEEDQGVIADAKTYFTVRIGQSVTTGEFLWEAPNK